MAGERPARGRLDRLSAIVVVSDMARSVAFYRDTFGLPLKFESPGWTELATEGATLALHRGESPPADASGMRRDQAGQCRPGLSVADLDGFHRLIVERNVRCAQAPIAAFGARVAKYVDPDGLVIHVSEARKAPS